jgi:hypothetical protein
MPQGKFCQVWGFFLLFGGGGIFDLFEDFFENCWDLLALAKVSLVADMVRNQIHPYNLFKKIHFKCPIIAKSFKKL